MTNNGAVEPNPVVHTGVRRRSVLYLALRGVHISRQAR